MCVSMAPMIRGYLCAVICVKKGIFLIVPSILIMRVQKSTGFIHSQNTNLKSQTLNQYFFIAEYYEKVKIRRGNKKTRFSKSQFIEITIITKVILFGVNGIETGGRESRRTIHAIRIIFEYWSIRIVYCQNKKIWVCTAQSFIIKPFLMLCETRVYSKHWVLDHSYPGLYYAGCDFTSTLKLLWTLSDMFHHEN